MLEAFSCYLELSLCHQLACTIKHNYDVTDAGQHNTYNLLHCLSQPVHSIIQWERFDVLVFPPPLNNWALSLFAEAHS